MISWHIKRGLKVVKNGINPKAEDKEEEKAQLVELGVYENQMTQIEKESFAEEVRQALFCITSAKMHVPKHKSLDSSILSTSDNP